MSTEVDIVPAVVLVLTFVWLLYSRLAENKKILDRPRRASYSIPWLGNEYEFLMDPLKFITNQRNVLGDCFVIHRRGKDVAFVTSSPLIAQVLQKRRDFERYPESVDQIHDAIKTSSPMAWNTSSIEQGIHEVFEYSCSISGIDYMAVLQKNIMSELLHIREQVRNAGAHDEFSLWELVFRSSYIAHSRSRYSCHAPHTPSPKIFDDWAEFAEAFSFITSRLPSALCHRYSNIYECFGAAIRESTVLNWLYRRNRQLDSYIQETNFAFERHGIHSESIAYNLLGFLWGAHSSNIWIIFWFVAHLVQNPEQLHVITTEVDRFVDSCGGQLSDIVFTPKNISLLDEAHLPALEAGFRETIRLSTAFAFSRRCSFRAVLYPSKRWPIRFYHGQNIIAFPRLVHMDPDNFDAPEKFDLNNFLADDNKTLRTSIRSGLRSIESVFFPWSNDETCEGKRLASQEFKLFLIIMLRLFNVSPRGTCVRGEKSTKSSKVTVPTGVMLNSGALRTREDLLVNLKLRDFRL